MIGLGNPYVWLGGVAVVLALVGTAAVTGYHKGYEARHQKAVAELADHLQRAIAQADDLAAADREVMAASAVRETRIQVRFQTIEREVVRYAENHRDEPVCLDHDGLLIWAAANAGAADPATATAPGASLPATGDAVVGEGGRPAGEPRGDGKGVSHDL